MNKEAALICTTLNCRDELDSSLEIFTAQRNLEMLKEIIIVDGGSRDGTWELLIKWSQKVSKLKIRQVPGANISRGRNEAIRMADADIVVGFDSGTKYNDDWLELMLKPFEDEEVSIVGGLTICCGSGLFAQCLAAFKDEPRAAIQPSHRGIAFYKKVWEKIGGYPEHVAAGEDTWFNTQSMKLGYKYVNVPEAKNFWEVRNSWKGVLKMQRRNAKGHIILAEPFGTAQMFLIALIYPFMLLCAICGFFEHKIWYAALVLYAVYLAKRMFGKNRWRIFMNPVKFAVGFYALTGFDIGMTIGVLEGSILFLKNKIINKTT
ncbi:MAG: hypothetical protein A2Y13_11600 [Planctomycetes bacterium GWC2_45_44]|nr:MAG: hypothetical protein A2Y13_11600 [Planctomycetes bacterium GWC2_45_44]HBR18945.1 hypothetical protein [Phycisphaerales bacterium]